MKNVNIPLFIAHICTEHCAHYSLLYHDILNIFLFVSEAG